MAYESNLAGLMIDLSYLSNLQIAEALGHYNDHIGIYSNSWGPRGNGRIVEGPDLLTTVTLKNGAEKVLRVSKGYESDPQSISPWCILLL